MVQIGEVAVNSNTKEIYVEWKLIDFASLSGICYCSPAFFLEGESWNLYTYPNGSKSINSIGCIDMYLCRLSSGPPIDVTFSFALKTSNGKKELERHCTKVFQEFNLQCIDRFISKSEYVRRKADFLVSGCLTVICTLKRLKSAGSTSATTVAKCSYCKKSFDIENISSHEKKCIDKPIKCPECSDVIILQNWYDHECQKANVKGGSNTLASSVIHTNNKILHNLKQLFLNQENCDVIFKIKTQEFSAHKSILIAQSPVFASIFRNNMKEKETGIVDIEDCDPSTFSDFLCFLYCGDTDNLSSANVFSLYTAADKYDVPDLRGKCIEFMIENLSVDTFCQTIALALQHTETELIHLSTDFFVKNTEEILETVKWQLFAIENPIQCNELFIKYVKSVKQCVKINISD